jgi:hypothetical protein
MSRPACPWRVPVEKPAIALAKHHRACLDGYRPPAVCHFRFSLGPGVRSQNTSYRSAGWVPGAIATNG